MSYRDLDKRRETRRRWRARHLEQERARRRSYRLVCPKCGGEMSGGHGPGRDPEMCQSCCDAARAAQHGTVSKYNGGCRCDDCRRANRDYMRAYRARKKAEAGP